MGFQPRPIVRFGFSRRHDNERSDKWNGPRTDIMQDRTHLVDDITGHRRMRRNRKADWTRRLVQENRLTVADLIWPIFIVPGSGIVDPIAAMPGVNRMSIDSAVEAAREAAS